MENNENIKEVGIQSNFFDTDLNTNTHNISAKPKTSKSKSELLGKDSYVERREKVKGMMARQLPEIVMAKVLNVPVTTIKLDVAAIRKKVRGSITEEDKFEKLTTHILKLEQIEDAAMTDYYAAEKGTAARHQFLKMALQARSDRARLELDSGILPKATENLAIDIQGIQSATQAELQEKKEMLLARLRAEHAN